jgi:hypothetical protein
MSHRTARLLLALALLAGLAAGALAQPRPVTEEREPCASHDPLRRPFFGDTHVHTTLSFDANAQDTRNGPRDAYRFAKGMALGIQPYDDQGLALRNVRIDRPLDFAAVTDHAEMFGEVRNCNTEGAPGYWTPWCVGLRYFPRFSFRAFATQVLVRKERFGFCGENGELCQETARTVWQEVQAAAEEAYDRTPACRFTSFVGYEWTGTVGQGRNLHRNVIFRNAKVPDYAVSWADVPNATALWDSFEKDCLAGKPGCDVLTIPHNSNLSGGLMFQSATLAREEEGGTLAITKQEAERRARFEPLVEMMQHKGDSECDLRAGWTDEACGFEKLPYDNFGDQTQGVRDPNLKPAPGNFVRWALGEGLRLQRDVGANPFRFGIIASTDTHIAAPGLVAEENHPGHGGAGLGAADEIPKVPEDWEFNPGGLAVLWAEENSRDALFAAMQRREAYGTSGTRPVVRFFGGWGYDAAMCGSPSFVADGYAKGVPMGGELPAKSGDAPKLAVWALADPGADAAPLQRVQIVKGALTGGKLEEQVIDVAGGPNDASVDLATCERRGAGATELCAVWSDPAFDASAPAYYYARVLENPSCRWSQYLCNELAVDCSRPESVDEDLAPCCAPEHRRTVQERAWTSPIWYQPAGS